MYSPITSSGRASSFSSGLPAEAIAIRITISLGNIRPPIKRTIVNKIAQYKLKVNSFLKKFAEFVTLKVISLPLRGKYNVQVGDFHSIQGKGTRLYC